MTTPERDQMTHLEEENAQLRARLQIAESALRADGRACSVCHRPLVIRQELDHIETPTGWLCMPCVERMGRGTTP